jgi:hypothetical protein
MFGMLSQLGSTLKISVGMLQYVDVSVCFFFPQKQPVVPEGVHMQRVGDQSFLVILFRQQNIISDFLQ